VKILIFGGEGMLGQALARAARGQGDQAVPLSRAECDILSGPAVRQAYEDHKPDAVFNCAAYTAVDDAESHVDISMLVNGEAPRRLAAVARENQTPFVQISTDYVFDGQGGRPYQETDLPNPLNVYGKSKLAGERAVLEAHPRALVVRSSGLYGPGGKNFVDTMLKLAGEGKSLRVVDDQRTAPTCTPDLAEGMLHLLQAGAQGIVHCTNAGDCSWYEFTRAILSLRRLSVPLAPVSTAEFPRPARRPAYSVLDNARFNKLTGCPLHPWAEALAAYLRTITPP
jgi:dTDP-4-dehydrorhamnose reductase